MFFGTFLLIVNINKTLIGYFQARVNHFLPHFKILNNTFHSVFFTNQKCKFEILQIYSFFHKINATCQSIIV